MTEYYPMEPVRDLIVGKYDVRTSRYAPVPLPSWNRYPCELLPRCKAADRKSCEGVVSIFINTEKIRWIHLEICFFREAQRAFIRAANLQMKKLFELEIIDRRYWTVMCFNSLIVKPEDIPPWTEEEKAEIKHILEEAEANGEIDLSQFYEPAGLLDENPQIL